MAMGAVTSTTYLVDVDDTLLDTAAVKAEMDRRLGGVLGEAGRNVWWETYESVRRDLGVVDIGSALSRFAGASSPDVRAELAAVFLRFPFADYLHREALEVLAHLRERGTVAIFSDGDPTFQTPKIIRSGLAAAVDGFVFVYRDKVAHLDDVRAALPADRFVLIDDKPKVLERVRECGGAPVTTVFVRQGRYAAAVPDGPWPGAEITIPRIGDLLRREV